MLIYSILRIIEFKGKNILPCLLNDRLKQAILRGILFPPRAWRKPALKLKEITDLLTVQ